MILIFCISPFSILIFLQNSERGQIPSSSYHPHCQATCAPQVVHHCIDWKEFYSTMTKTGEYQRHGNQCGGQKVTFCILSDYSCCYSNILLHTAAVNRIVLYTVVTSICKFMWKDIAIFLTPEVSRHVLWSKWHYTNEIK